MKTPIAIFTRRDSFGIEIRFFHRRIRLGYFTEPMPTFVFYGTKCEVSQFRFWRIAVAYCPNPNTP